MWRKEVKAGSLCILCAASMKTETRRRHEISSEFLYVKLSGFFVSFANDFSHDECGDKRDDREDHEDENDDDPSEDIRVFQQFHGICAAVNHLAMFRC